ncbi:serine/threonine-protein kinase, partial [Streptomyces sp. NPDC046832]|uniref:serine/threonine-protein kinase n=1 Tax=Streptomyces sp. NPDC046832 TaxID=3155020 RepID=UPI0033F513C0
MGTVWRAHDIRLGRSVAVKLLHHAADDQLVTRFKREARITAHLSGHAHIISVYDYGLFRDQHERELPFVIMELLDGKQLGQFITEPPTLPIAQAVDWCAQISDALAAAHDVGIVHRDVKPANVILARMRSGREIIKVLDFGIAAYTHVERTRITGVGQIVGSPAYMAPEQFRTDYFPEERTDLYALGCLLYALLTGRPPFVYSNSNSISRAHAEEIPVAPSSHRPEIPWGLDVLTLRLLAKNPDERPQAAAELRDLLRQVLGQQAGISPLPAVLATQAERAAARAKVGEYVEAARMYSGLAADQARILGPEHPDTLTSRHSQAQCLGEAGEHAEAARLAARVAADQARVLGPEHRDTLTSRRTHAWWLGKAGQLAEAARLAAGIAADSARVLGPEHPDTLTSRHSQAQWMGEVGEHAEAARLAARVAADQARVLGPEHRDTLTSRRTHAWWLGEAGQLAEAARLAAG